MLYGHIENDEDRVDHLLKLRALQTKRADSRPSFLWHFIRKHAARPPSRNHRLTDFARSVSRLLLDNFPHIKAYWQMLTPKIAQIACASAPTTWTNRDRGEIYHDAGATTPQGMTARTVPPDHRRRPCPVERDTLYHAVSRTDDSFTVAV